MYVLWRDKTEEAKNRPQHINQNEYDEFGKNVSLMLSMCRPIFRSRKSVALGSVFCGAQGIRELKYKFLYAGDLIKKCHYWPKIFTGKIIDTNFKEKKVGFFGMLEARTQDNKSF